MSEEKSTTKTITESTPVINKVLMVDHGRGGLKVGYGVAQTINGVMNQIKCNDLFDRAVQKEIRDLFLDLRVHLLKATQYYWPNDKIEAMLIAKCVVTSVATKKDQIIISGYMQAGGSHHNPISTSHLSDEYYNDFAELKTIVTSLFEEAKLFMSGVKSATAKTIVVDFMTKKKDIPDAEDAYSKMTQAEIDEITKEALHDSGLRIVIEDGVEVISPEEEPASNQLSMLIEEEEEGAQEIEESEFVDPAGPTAEVDTDEFMEL